MINDKSEEKSLSNEDCKYLDNYFKIDSKNTFSIENSENTNDKLNKLLEDNKEFIEEYLDNNNKLISLFYEKIYKTDTDSFNICLTLSKQLRKSLNINKNMIDEKLDYFINKKMEYKISKEFKLDRENTFYLGYILSYAYSKFSSFKINNEKDLILNVDKTKKEHIDLLTKFYSESIGNENPQNRYSKVLFCKKNKTNINLPGVYILLINAFIYIKDIDIDFNFDEQLTKDEVNLFIISLLNLQYIFSDKINIKINLINEGLQCLVYRRFYKELFKNTKFGNFKMIYMNKDDIYKKKWDFETEFLLEKHRKINKNDSNQNNETTAEDNASTNMNTNDNSNNSNSNTPKTPDKDNIFNSSFNNNKLSEENNSKNYKSDKNVCKALNLSNSKIEANNSMTNYLNSSINVRSNLTKSIINKTQINNSSSSLVRMTNNPNEKDNDLHYDQIIEAYKNTIGLILLTIDSLYNFTNMRRLDLIINDCYQSEIYSFLYNYCSVEVSKRFHMVDILINKVKTLEELNIELNILDHITFSKILSFIDNNSSLTSLKLSFFSSDVTYLRQTIYKLYYQNINTKATSISQILDYILPNFIENLEVLFELIKKKDLKTIAVNFDTPDLIEINNPYMNTIFKFLMNIIFLVDNPKSHIEKLLILSPSTKFDSRFLPSIENILEDINFEDNNKTLTELSLHLQLFMVKNIKNLITERLISLNIGDCDINTFKELTKYLTSYKFSKNSFLKKLSISLLDSIIEYTNEIKTIFYKIFSIKIKQLTELNLYTNIYMNKDSYLDLVDIFRNNWTSKLRLILNPKTEFDPIYLEEEKNKIKFLVSHTLEEKLLSKDELITRNKIFYDKEKKMIKEFYKNDNIFWFVWRVLNKNGKNKPQINKKDIIFNVLQYLYFTKNIEISHKLED